MGFFSKIKHGFKHPKHIGRGFISAIKNDGRVAHDQAIKFLKSHTLSDAVGVSGQALTETAPIIGLGVGLASNDPAAGAQAAQQASDTGKALKQNQKTVRRGEDLTVKADALIFR